MPSARQDPYLDFNFVVEIDDVASAGFREARAPAGQIEVVAYREGTDMTSARAAAARPGRVRPARSAARLRRRLDPVPVVASGCAGDARPAQRLGRPARRAAPGGRAVEPPAGVADEVRRAVAQRSRKRGRVETLELAHEGIELA